MHVEYACFWNKLGTNRMTLWSVKSFEPGHEKMCFMPYVNNKGADQPAHTRSLISTFVVRCLDSIIHGCLFIIAELLRP